MTRETLHRLVEDLPETHLGAAESALASLREAEDPVVWTLEHAPFDDEPETPAERAAVEAARRELREGARTYSTEELLAELAEEAGR